MGPNDDVPFFLILGYLAFCFIAIGGSNHKTVKKPEQAQQTAQRCEQKQK